MKGREERRARGERERWKRKGRDEDRARMGGVGGWKRQFFGSALSPGAEERRCASKVRRAQIICWRAQRHCADGCQAGTRLWQKREERWTCGELS